MLQDVFVRAYGALRDDNREMNVRAWLYRVAHNRCIDHLRRPVPPAAEIFEISRKPLHDPIEEAQRREDLRRLVADVGRLPEQQRSALLMREIDGMTYADLADALDVTVPAVKSLLVRARVGLVEAAEARDADCAEIRADLLRAYDRGVKASGRARRHMRDCDGCREYRGALRGMRRSFAALTPGRRRPAGARRPSCSASAAPAAARPRAARRRRGGGGARGGVATATACKVAAVVCTAAIATAGGAVEVNHRRAPRTPRPPRRRRATKAAGRAAGPPRAARQSRRPPRAAPARAAPPAPAVRDQPAQPPGDAKAVGARSSAAGDAPPAATARRDRRPPRPAAASDPLGVRRRPGARRAGRRPARRDRAAGASRPGARRRPRDAPAGRGPAGRRRTPPDRGRTPPPTERPARRAPPAPSP